MRKNILLSVICAILVLPCSIVQATTSTNSFLLRSGRHVSVSAVRKHHPRIRLQDLPHVLFEHNEDDSICSHYACLNMAELAPEDHLIVRSDKSGDEPNRLSSQQSSRSTKIRSGHGYSFAIIPCSGSLITAWGPALHLHPLNTVQYPGIFVNAAVLESPSFTDAHGTIFDRVSHAVSRIYLNSPKSSGKSDRVAFQFSEMRYLRTASRQEWCTKVFTLELAFEYDKSFCSLYNDDHNLVLRGLDALEYQVSQLFIDAACVRVVFVKSNGICRNQTSFVVKPPKTPPTSRGQCSGFGPCRFSQTMLRFISNNSIDAFYFEPDGTFLFTGYGDNSSLGGATYRASACNMELSAAWVVRNHAIVIAHEVGHMLGAGHDTSGIMKEVVDPTEPLFLSGHSKSVMRRFVQLDSRSWCLRRQSLFTDALAGPRLKSSSKIPTSATFASLASESYSDLIIIFQDPDESESTVSYLTESAISCNHTTRQFLGFDYKSIDLRRKQVLQVDFPNRANAFSVGFGHILNVTSRDLLLSFSIQNNGKTLTYYKVGYGIGQDGSPPMSWSHSIYVPNLSAENIQCSSIAIGHIRSSSSVDLVVAIIDRRNHLNVMKYTVGFDIGPNGEPRGGWTMGINVPGWYGQDTSSLGISLLDVDNNGQSEILVYHVAKWRLQRVPYLRVGRDLGNDGRVTGGWSKFVQGEDSQTVETYLFNGGMTATRTECAGVVVASLSEDILSTKPSVDYKLSKHFITKELLDTSENLDQFDYFQDGCFKCYSASYAQVCAEVLLACSSHVDEVHLALPGSRASPPLSRTQDLKFKAHHFSAPIPITNSIYCTGFHYLFTHYGGCEITDQQSVLAKGVEQAFLEALNEVDTNALQNSTSTSLHEDPAGVGGTSRKPVAAVITIEDENISRGAVIKRALRKLQRRPGFSVFSYDVTLRKITRKGGRWYVNFSFKRKPFKR